MSKYWWIIRTNIICKCKCSFSKGVEYDTFIEWYNIPKLIYWLIKYRGTDYWCTFTWVDEE